MIEVIQNYHPLGFLQNLSTPEFCLMGLVLLLFFGAKRLPGLFRSLGQSVHEFKRGKMQEEDASGNSPEIAGVSSESLPKG